MTAEEIEVVIADVETIRTAYPQFEQRCTRILCDLIPIHAERAQAERDAQRQQQQQGAGTK